MDNLQIFSGPKSAKYGYQLNPYNTMIGALYEYHIAVKKIKRPMSDTERREWEAMVWKYFDKCMFSCSISLTTECGCQELLPRYTIKKLPQAAKTPEGAEK